MSRLTREQAAIIGAFTGILAGPWSDLHQYAERVLGRPIWTHEFVGLAPELREAARPDFAAIVGTTSRGGCRCLRADAI